jgi:Domain of unknown function (DUF4145)
VADKDKVISSWCNSCGRETSHAVLLSEVLATMEYPDGEAETRSVVVRCRGCGELAIRNEDLYYDRTPDPSIEDREHVTVTFSPPRLWRRPPDWLSDLEVVEVDLNDILKEVYLAANDKQFRLLAMGVRTALDYVMTQIIGDVGDFSQKLREMVAKNHLTAKQTDMLATVIDAASAAAHRGFKPDRPLLQEMLNTMETVIRDHYLTGPMLART